MSALKLNFKFFILVSSLFLAYSGFTQTGEINIEQDSEIPQLLEQKLKMSKKNEFGDRFKIQLYYGNNQQASNYATRFRSLYSKWSSDVVYETPNYKVWVGNFRNKLEADRALMEIKNKFPSAFIFKPERG